MQAAQALDVRGSIEGDKTKRGARVSGVFFKERRKLV